MNPSRDTARKGFRALLRDSRGNAFVEFALITPFLVLALLGVIELGSFALLNQKLQNAAMNIADLSSREEEITQAQITDLLNSVSYVLQPYAWDATDAVILTGVSADNDNAPVVFWQYKSPTNTSFTSSVGKPGNNATLPASIPVRAQDTIIVAEVYYTYKHWLLGIVSDKVLVKSAYYRPRLGSLRSIN